MSVHPGIYHHLLVQGQYRVKNATINADQFLVLFAAAGRAARREANWIARLDGFDDHLEQFLCLNLRLKYKP